MKVDLVIPPLMNQKGDVFGSGIPYMSMEVPYTAAALRAKGHEPAIIDAFGEKPYQLTKYKGKYFLRGLNAGEVAARIRPDAGAVMLSSNSGLVSNYGIAYDFLRELIKSLKARFSAKIVVTGNFATVAPKDFLDAGADYVLLSEYEESGVQLIGALENGDAEKIAGIDGIAFLADGKMHAKAKQKFIENPDVLPFPAWDLMPLENYWKLGYSHGPFQGKYLPLLTSRGCPLACKFCFVPGIWERRWKPRTAKNVVDEIEEFGKRFGVHDFHVEDFNPTVNKARIVEICKDIIARGLKVTIKFAAGTKVETYDDETLEWMAKAGVNYISISPESGSPRVLKLMAKVFNHDYALARVKTMRRLGIKSQACFVLGFPGETDADLSLTEGFIGKLVDAGIDEVTLFIMTPVPGAPAATENEWHYDGYESLSFSPVWRGDYRKLSRLRTRLYIKFFLLKLLKRPLASVRSFINIFARRFETKYEMTAYRVWDTYRRLYLGF